MLNGRGKEVGPGLIGRPANENEKTPCKGDLLPRQGEKEMQQKDRVHKQPGCSSPALEIEGMLLRTVIG